MKVIIKKTGKIEDVSEGHARNYLLPKGLAVIATSDKVAAVTAQHKKAEQEQAQKLAAWDALAKSLNEKTVQLKAAANDDGTLFGSVSESAILEAMSAQHRVTLQREWLHIGSPIKHVGNHEVVVEFPNKAKATFAVTIAKH